MCKVIILYLPKNLSSPCMHENNILELRQIFRGQHSTFHPCVYSIPITYYGMRISMMTFAELLETIFNHSVKGAE